MTGANNCEGVSEAAVVGPLDPGLYRLHVSVGCYDQGNQPDGRDWGTLTLVYAGTDSNLSTAFFLGTVGSGGWFAGGNTLYFSCDEAQDAAVNFPLEIELDESTPFLGFLTGDAGGVFCGDNEGSVVVEINACDGAGGTPTPDPDITETPTETPDETEPPTPTSTSTPTATATAVECEEITSAQITPYKQGGSKPWANYPMPFNYPVRVGNRIRDIGCFLTCYSMMDGRDPGVLDEDFTSKNLIGSNGNLRYVPAAPEIGLFARGTEVDPTPENLAGFLKFFKHVVVMVVNNTTRRTHYVMVTGQTINPDTEECDFSIEDPGRDRDFLSEYDATHSRRFAIYYEDL